MKGRIVTSLFLLAMVAAGRANLVCVYDFDGSLAPKVNYGGAANLKFVKGIGTVQDAGTPAYSTQTVGSTTKKVAYFDFYEGFQVQTNMAANGGGSRVNQYTLIWDLYVLGIPANQSYFSFYQTNPNNTDDGDMFYRNGVGLGISADYKNSNPPFAYNKWQRIAMSVDLTTKLMSIYVDGNLANAKTLSTGVDGRWSLEPNTSLKPYFHIFMDEDGENAKGYISQFAVYNHALSQNEILALGEVGKPVPEPATMALLGLGALGLMARRKKS